MNITSPEMLSILDENLSSDEVGVINFLIQAAKSVDDSNSKYIPWYKYRQSIANNITLEQYKTLYKSKYALKFLSMSFNNEHMSSSVLRDIYTRFPGLANDILDFSLDHSLIVHLITLGYHRGIRDINKLADSPYPSVREYAVSRCDINTLESLRKDSNKKVRLQAYKRLGVDEYIDEMLEDKNLEIRLLAAQAAPMYYPKFKEMANELSKRVFMEVARKIDTKHIPYILGNRNTKGKYIKEILSKRLSDGNINFKGE